MEHGLVSVVVPVFKVEQFLEDCVQSIIDQTYPYFELILVDDGSPDNCGIICDRLAEKDHRITVIHKTNGGLSDARNAGIEKASGQYITFIDSDDLISSHYLQILMEAMIRYHAGIVQGRHSREVGELTEKTGYNAKAYYDNDEILREYLTFGELNAYAWNKLYDIRLFKTLRYPVGKIQEDAWTTYKAMMMADCIVAVDAVTYFYRLNADSIMNGRFNPKRFEIMGVPDDIREFLQAQGYGDHYQELLDYYTMRLGNKTFKDFLQS